jgi:plastocyanin
VSRGPAAFAVVALLGGLSLVPGTGAIVGTSQSAAADCAWQRHSKRIVKHAQRDGRPLRVVRIKHWWTCNPLVVPPAIAAPQPPSAPSPGPIPTPPPPEPEPPPRRVSVKAKEFSFTLSRLYVVAGEVTVELNNQGEDPHNLKLQRVGGASPELEVGEAGPDESRVAHLDLSPGTYRLWCSLPQHDEWGMNVALAVNDG